MLRNGSRAKPEDAVTPKEEIKIQYVLEFLGLEDETAGWTGRAAASLVPARAAA
ncbi:MAG: hypothetical protein AB1Z98_11565 [Nannocystaceae bacterium]